MSVAEGALVVHQDARLFKRTALPTRWTETRTRTRTRMRDEYSKYCRLGRSKRKSGKKKEPL